MAQVRLRFFPTEICRSIFDKLVDCRKRNKKLYESDSSRLARCDGKMSFHYLRLFPLVSYRSVNTPRVINTILGHYAPFLGGNFLGLAARARKIPSPLLNHHLS